MVNIIFNLILFISSVIGDFLNGQNNPISKPVITPSSGTYPNPILVTISSETPNVTIYYTTTGNTPVIGAVFTKVYQVPFTILESTTIKAIAISPSLGQSMTSTSIINITNSGICSKPIFSNPSGEYQGFLNLSISTPTVDGQIWYTTNGNTPRIDIPNSFTKLYDSPIDIYENVTIKAMTVKNGLVNSPITTSNYTITDPKITSNPMFNLPPGQYIGPQIITMTSLTEGATIYYTTNGNIPKIDSPNTFTKVYSTPLTLNTNITLRAIAVKSGYRPSAVSVTTYYFCN